MFSAQAIFSTMVFAAALTGEVLFTDPFAGKLADGWTIMRENPDTWRVTEDALEIRIEPGNMWGGSNDARNVLVRPLPDVGEGSLAISCMVENDPASQYEQVDLVWYYDDSHMVKIGLEQVDEVRTIVMGREEDDKTRTINIIPMPSTKVELRLTVTGNTILGEFRIEGKGDWQEAGSCDLPAKGAHHASLQCYQGVEDIEHWAKITDFKVER